MTSVPTAVQRLGTSCSECTRLRSEYGLLTARHADFTEALRLAIGQDNESRIQYLEPYVEQARLDLEVAVAAVYSHEADVHAHDPVNISPTFAAT